MNTLYKIIDALLFPARCICVVFALIVSIAYMLIQNDDEG